ncbi:MAG: TonB-dependent receptor plug domain-containing protein [Bacteroidales bacterium]|nr:TonB-dependent receptor plug domain-containing protein [Bacteroidales bacterium]
MKRKFLPLILSVLLLTPFTIFAQVQPDSTQAVQVAIPTITISDSELENENESHDLSGLLQSSSDVFVSTANFTFSPSRFRIRGYDSENHSVHINGLPVNDVETGRAYWSSWGGLNDAVRNKEVNDGVSMSDFSFGGVGGSTNIIARASEYRTGTRLTYSVSNRSYRNRVMLTHSTGMNDKGWAFTYSGSRRWSEEGYVAGTFYDAWSYFFSAEKKINSAHSLGFTVFGAPTKRGKQGVVTQEVLDYAGTNYYNPYWGYQNGEKRNAAVSNFHQPMALFTHYWKINEKSKLTSSAGYSFGRGGSTALNWDNTGDPRPDYYRYLPSYWSEPMDDEDLAYQSYYTNLWTGDEAPQLNWDAMYNANYKNLYTIENVDGTANNLTGYRSIYMIEDRRNDVTKTMISSVYNSNPNEKMAIVGGVNAVLFKGRNFKTVSDLLGGDFWLDIDKFAEMDANNPAVMDNNLDVPNHAVYEDDVFGYDYTTNVNKYEGFGQVSYSLKKFDLFLGIDLSQTQFWYTGNMQNGKFPDDSYGDSEKQSFFNYGLKTGILYKITGRNFISINGAYLNRAPFIRNAYISPRTRDHIVSGLESETIISGDANYIYRGPLVKARLTGFYTEFNDRVWARSFYHDELATFVNYMMTDVDVIHGGGELGVEVKASQTITIQAAASKADYYYNSRPKVTIARDNDSEILAENRTVFFKGYKLGGMPHTAISGGLKYNSPKFWFAGINANLFSDIYVEPNPERRTLEALEGIYPDDPQWDLILEQEKLPDYFTLDIYGYKSWKVKKYFIGLYVAVGNILNKTDIRTGGFEQLRFSTSYARLHTEGIDKFPSKYFYMFGRTYFVNINFSF